MEKNGKQRAPHVFEVPAGPHVGGKPLSGLTARQKQAVKDLGISEEEWDTCTWQFREHEFSKLKQAEGLAAVALGFDPKSWFLFAAIVRSKHARWLKQIKDQKRAQENKTASPRGEAASAPKRVSPGASSSKAAASLRARAQQADVDAVAPVVEEVVVNATETRWLGKGEGLYSAGISLKNLHVRALKALYFWVIEGTKVD